MLSFSAAIPPPPIPSFPIACSRLLWGAGNSGSVILMNPNGWGSPLTNFTFIPLPPAPIISSVSPDTAYTGTTITIHGAHFTGANMVRFGGIDAASFIVISDSLLTAVTGSGGFWFCRCGNSQRYGLSVRISLYLPCPGRNVVLSGQRSHGRGRNHPWFGFYQRRCGAVWWS